MQPLAIIAGSVSILVIFVIGIGAMNDRQSAAALDQSISDAEDAQIIADCRSTVANPAGSPAQIIETCERLLRLEAIH